MPFILTNAKRFVTHFLNGKFVSMASYTFVFVIMSIHPLTVMEGRTNCKCRLLINECCTHTHNYATGNGTSCNSPKYPYEIIYTSKKVIYKITSTRTNPHSSLRPSSLQNTPRKSYHSKKSLYKITSTPTNLQSSLRPSQLQNIPMKQYYSKIAPYEIISYPTVPQSSTPRDKRYPITRSPYPQSHDNQSPILPVFQSLVNIGDR